jgi:ethanolamine utilization protein EutQ (cupin superfamily)
VSDLVHRRLYGYAESGAPLVTLAAQEIHAVIDGRLYLRASSEGMSAEGEPVAYTMTGTLSRISR